MDTLQQIENKLRLISRAASDECADMDVVSRAACDALNLLRELKEQTLLLPLIEDASTLVVYEPRA